MRPDDVCVKCKRPRAEHADWAPGSGYAVCAIGEVVLKDEGFERAPTVAGVGKDAPTVTNAAGGKQSHSPYRADLLPPHALLAVAKVLAEGAAKYGANNWHKIPAADNLNHAMVHLLAIQAGDTSDEHLEHAATRILFALDQVLSGREAKLQAALAEKGGAA